MKDGELGTLLDVATVTLAPIVPGLPQFPLEYSV